MEAKEYKLRQRQKTDTTENWGKATGFVPLKGEMIVYQDGNASKLKVGNGETVVGQLPFVAGEGGIFINDYITCSELGLSEEDEGGNNYTKLREYDFTKPLCVDGKYKITLPSLGEVENVCLFESTNKNLVVFGKGNDPALNFDLNRRNDRSTIFKITSTENCIINIQNVKFSCGNAAEGSSGSIELILVPSLGNYFKYLIIQDCYFTGSIIGARFSAATSQTTVAERINTIDFIRINNNLYENLLYSHYKMNDVVFNVFEANYNMIHNFSGIWLDTSTTNSLLEDDLTKEELTSIINRKKKKLVVGYNIFQNDDDWIIGYRTNVVYVCALMAECDYCHYHDNLVEGMKLFGQVKGADYENWYDTRAFYDAYMSCNEVLSENNIYKNNFLALDYDKLYLQKYVDLEYKMSFEKDGDGNYKQATEVTDPNKVTKSIRLYFKRKNTGTEENPIYNSETGISLDIAGQKPEASNWKVKFYLAKSDGEIADGQLGSEKTLSDFLKEDSGTSAKFSVHIGDAVNLEKLTRPYFCIEFLYNGQGSGDLTISNIRSCENNLVLEERSQIRIVDTPLMPDQEEESLRGKIVYIKTPSYCLMKSKGEGKRTYRGNKFTLDEPTWKEGEKKYLYLCPYIIDGTGTLIDQIIEDSVFDVYALQAQGFGGGFASITWRNNTFNIDSWGGGPLFRAGEIGTKFLFTGNSVIIKNNSTQNSGVGGIYEVDSFDPNFLQGKTYYFYLMSGALKNLGEVYEISNNYFENLRHPIGQVYTKQLNIFNNTFYKSFALVSGRAERYYATGNVCDKLMNQFESQFDTYQGHSEIQIMGGDTISSKAIMKQRSSAAYRYLLKLQGQVTPELALTDGYMPKIIDFQLFVIGDYYSLDNGTSWKKLTDSETDIDVTDGAYDKKDQGLLLRFTKSSGTWALRRRVTGNLHMNYNLKMTIDTYYGLGWATGSPSESFGTEQTPQA